MSHDSNWWTQSRALNVSTHDSLWDAAFSDDSQPAYSAMRNAWENDLTRLEGFLDGNVGTHHPTSSQDEDADGFGPLGPKLRGYNFREHAFTDVFKLRTQDAFSVVPEPNLDYGSGVDPSPLPGGTMRFYVGRGGSGGKNGLVDNTSFTSPPVAVWVYYTATIVAAGLDQAVTSNLHYNNANPFWVQSKLNGTIVSETRVRLRQGLNIRGAMSSQVSLSWALPGGGLPGFDTARNHIVAPDSMNTLSEKGWNVISHDLREQGRGTMLVTKGTQLIVVVAYR